MRFLRIGTHYYGVFVGEIPRSRREFECFSVCTSAIRKALTVVMQLFL